MKHPEFRRFERGLSLVWSLVLFFTLTSVAFVGVMSFAKEKNLFAEYWNKAVTEWNAQTGGKVQSAVGSAINSTVGSASPAPSSELRKCVVKGVVTYSNVECGADNRTSRKVDVRPSEGVGPAGVSEAKK